MLTRRQVFASGATVIGGAAFLAACTSSNGTVTIDTKKIVTYATAADQALTAALASPAITVALGASVALAEAYLKKFEAGVAAVTAAAPNGTLSVTVDTTTIQSAVQTLVSDAEQVATFVQGVLAAVTDPATVANVGNWVSAVETLLPLIELAAGLLASKKRTSTMSADAALAICYSAH